MADPRHERSHPFVSHRSPVGFAHRGGAGTSPENTLAAFGAAVRRGFTHVETDVHVTTDGVLVAFHDDRLDRVTDRTGAISELTWREVAAARVHGTEPIPRLEDLLVELADVHINIDPKSDAAVGPLAEVLRRHDALDRVCVGSFSDRRLARLHAEFGSSICLGMGPAEVTRLVAASLGLPAGRFRGRVAQLPVRQGPVPVVTRRLVAAAHRRGIRVYVWTVDDPDEMHRLLDLGVDGIMTDDLDALVSVFGDRGLWRDDGDQ